VGIPDDAARLLNDGTFAGAKLLNEVGSPVDDAKLLKEGTPAVDVISFREVGIPADDARLFTDGAANAGMEDLITFVATAEGLEVAFSTVLTVATVEDTEGEGVIGMFIDKPMLISSSRDKHPAAHQGTQL
jgi:hypothetical protein